MATLGSWKGSESEFVDHATPLLCRHFGSQPDDANREVSVGRAVADVVLAFPQRRRVFSTRPLSTNESVILATLRGLGFATRIDILERHCGLKNQALREGMLDGLLADGIIRQGPGGRVSMTRFSRLARILAFEAKLDRWREAIQQATSYRCFADLSFVVMPESALGTAKQRIDLFRSYGVGLIGIGSCKVTIHTKGSRSDDFNWQREFLISRLLA